MGSTTLAGLSLPDLEYAVAVGELRHFGHAAERCGVSQSALSEQIRKLEAVLGVALFERTKRRVDPTPRGAALLRRAEGILVDARGLIEAARVSAEPLTGPLRLGVIAASYQGALMLTRKKARGLCPLDPHWGRRPQTPFPLLCGCSNRFFAKGNGVWGLRPQRGPGAEPLAFLMGQH